MASYCIGTGYASNIYAEKNIFSSSKAKSTPYKNYATKSGYTDYNITMTGNSGASDVQKRSGSNDYFIPTDYYTLTLQEPTVIEADIRQYAGATLPVEYGKEITSGINLTTATAVKAEYFTVSGIRLSQPQSGINIVRYKMSDGTVTTKKIMMR